MIIIDYLVASQLCKISTDLVDKNWKQIRFQFNQIATQSEVYETSIELPWHSFISNINILQLASGLYQIKISFTPIAKRLFEESIKNKTDISTVDNVVPLTNEEIEIKLSFYSFKRSLTKEQLRNLCKLSRISMGATFSVPGAGKTTEAIAFYLLRRKENQGLLVICPKNAFPAWEEQFLICMGNQTPTIRRLTQGVDKIENDLKAFPNDVFLISYQQFNRVVDCVASHLQNKQSFVFIDESHRMKGGEKTDTGRQIQRIAHLPIGKLIMSGTPMPNSVSDLVSQYSFLFPTDGEIKVKNVIDKIKKIYVRTTKNELLKPEDFPIYTIRTEIPFSEPQKNLYDLIRSEELRQLSGISNNDRKFYRQLGKSYMRLLQIASNPSLLLKTVNNFPDALRETIENGDSSKIKYVAIKARKLSKAGKKVLVWSGFVEIVE